MGKAPDKIRARVAAKKKAQKAATRKVQAKPAAKPSSRKKTAPKTPARPKSKASTPQAPQTHEERKAKRRDYDRRKRAERKAKLEGLAAQATADAKRNHADAEKTRTRAPTGRKRGMREFIPSVDDRRQVQTLAGLGIPLDQVRVLIINPRTGKPVDEGTFKEKFHRELVAGPAVVNSQIAGTLLKSAKGHMVTIQGGKKGQQRVKYVAPNVTAQIFLAKVRLGWREEQHVTVDIKSGVLVAPGANSVQDWLAGVAERNAAATEPGASED